MKYIGAHVSAAKNLSNALRNMVNIDGTACAFFLKSRQWKVAPLSDDIVEEFQRTCQTLEINRSMLVPHGQYIINLAQPDYRKRKQAFDYFLDDLKRCEKLGISLYNIHPGSTVGDCSRAEGIQHIANCINEAHQETRDVCVLLENMANAGGKCNLIGSKFEDLRDIISLVKDKQRIGVCFDTCHAFAAGYDIRTPEKYEETWSEFQEVVGLKYLKAVHLNDSKMDLGSNKDRHANIGKGKLGMQVFEMVMRDSRLDNLPIILETPLNPNRKDEMAVWREEIELLRSL